MKEFFYNGLARLDWGFENPNITGAFIAILMLTIWPLAYLPGKWGRFGFWVALLVNTILGYCLVHTISRSALVALVAGAFPLVWNARPWKKSIWLPIAIVVVSLVSWCFCLGAAGRYAQGMNGYRDMSLVNRWTIYRMVPRMIWDAPEGWGTERAGEAFRQWYQPIGRTETYARLVNSHATWMAEWSWKYRLLYGLGWFVVIVLLMPVAKRNWMACALGVWGCFAVGACFSSTAHRWQLWVAPVFLLMAAISYRVWVKQWPSLRMWLMVPVALLVLFGGVWLWAQTTPSNVRLRDGLVEIGTASDIWLVTKVEERIIGQIYGHRLRQSALQGQHRFLIAWHSTSSSWPAQVDVILPGSAVMEIDDDASKRLRSAKTITLINPSKPSLSFINRVVPGRKIVVAFGSLFAGRERYFWESLTRKYPNNVSIVTIEGAGAFVRDWPRRLEPLINPTLDATP